MSWLQRYRLRAYFRNSIWILPVLAMVVALASGRLLHTLEEVMADVSDSQGVGGVPGLRQGRREAQPGADLSAPRSAQQDVVPTRSGDRQGEQEGPP
jgi:hypothetical protein